MKAVSGGGREGGDDVKGVGKVLIGVRMRAVIGAV